MCHIRRLGRSKLWIDMQILPDCLTNDINLGEKAFREACKSQLSSQEGFILHSVGISQHPSKIYSEADFIVISTLGVFCLEVKGGEVLQRTDGIWEIGWQSTGKFYTSSEGPFKQSQACSAAVINLLRKHRLQNVPVFWGVVFPHFEFIQNDPEWDEFQICDMRKLGDIEKFLSELASGFRNKLQLKGLDFHSRELNAYELKNIKNVLRRDIHISWEHGSNIATSRKELAFLEENQENILDEFVYSDVPRMVLRGCAGTGKTLLAKKAAEISSKNRSKVLFIVFNRLLKEELSQHFQGHDVEVATILEFMSRTMKKFGHDPLSTSDVELYSLSFYDAIVGNKNITDADKFDILICDEAQDFMSEEIGRGLFELLRGNGQRGSWLLCLDDIVQSEVYGIYSRQFINKLETETSCNSRELFRNYRNPKQIANHANHLYPDEKMAIPSRKFDSFPKIMTYASAKEEVKQLERLIRNLTNSGVQPESITVLTFSAKQNSNLRPARELAGFSFGNLQDNEANSIEWSQIGAYKGLENDIIILVELPERVLSLRKAELFVAMTRAKTELYVICPKNGEFIEGVKNG